MAIRLPLFHFFWLFSFLLSSAIAEETGSPTWQERAVRNGRIMSQVKWTPVADTMPSREGFYETGTEYTGTPYSSVRSVGRYIGFDIFLKTFLAAVENPESVLYTEDLTDTLTNAECYYGKVCSTYTSYALECGIWYLSWLHGPDHREGVSRVDPPVADSAQIGDIIFRPPSRPGGSSHIELITQITRDHAGEVTHVRVEESRPPTTWEIDYDRPGFAAHIKKNQKELYRITDLDAWRAENRADAFLFPNYKEDSATPSINRVLLLDRGDWVPYDKNDPVKFNIMDRDKESVAALVIKRGGSIVETIAQPKKGVVERSFSLCGDYTAHCVMTSGAVSAACEFSVCDLGFEIASESIQSGTPLELTFDSDNMNVIILHVVFPGTRDARHNLFLSKAVQEAGRITIPAGIMENQGKMRVTLIGENRYGRLKRHREYRVGDPLSSRQ